MTGFRLWFYILKRFGVGIVTEQGYLIITNYLYFDAEVFENYNTFLISDPNLYFLIVN